MIDVVLLRIAKSAILAQLDKNYILNKDAATFVTLKYKHQLRGCIGSIFAHEKLFYNLIHNAKSAAFSEPRFSPLKSDEFTPYLGSLCFKHTRNFRV